MKTCERCNKKHDGKYGSGRFCSSLCSHTRLQNIDWNIIQKFYDAGKRWKDITIQFGVCQGTINKAAKCGQFKTRTRYESRKLRGNLYGFPKPSEKTKKKISEIRIKYLQEHPDKVPYIINHSSHNSYPELKFKKLLEESGLTGWVYKHRNGIYEYDFAFLELKIDVEIDGGTHTSEKVKKIDIRRDAWSKMNGWTVIRITTKELSSNPIKCINKIKELYLSLNNTPDESL